jgi:ABC-2 type transport system ATP-binding protein
MDSIISVCGLVKRYGRHEAVAGIDLEVRRGAIFALLGANGAGKSIALIAPPMVPSATGGAVTFSPLSPVTCEAVPTTAVGFSARGQHGNVHASTGC